MPAGTAKVLSCRLTISTFEVDQRGHSGARFTECHQKNENNSGTFMQISYMTFQGAQAIIDDASASLRQFGDASPLD